YIPFAGNAISGAVDPAYQNAMHQAEVLATMVLEYLPKSRFQPSTIHGVMKQIAPEVGDGPQERAAKLRQIEIYRKAIRARASNPQDLPDPTDLSDAPQPPGIRP